jgi:hypothetical protein
VLDIPTAITRHGWAIQAVLDDGPGVPPFAYSIGLHERGLPELIVVGVCTDHATRLAQLVAETVTGPDADILEPGGTVALPPGFPWSEVRLGAVADEWARRYLLGAYDRYGEDRDLDVLQILVPDASGRYDGPDVEPRILELQPLLSEVDRPWRLPLGRRLLECLEPPGDERFLLLPILAPDGPLGREELVTAEPLADGTWVVTSQPALADWCTVGTIVDAGPVDLRCPLSDPLPEVVRYRRVVRESHWLAERWSWHGRSQDDADRLFGAVAVTTTGPRARVFGPSAMPHALTVGVQPREAEPLRSAMRHLERDGLVVPRPLFHRPEEGDLAPRDPRCVHCEPGA